MAVAIGYVGMAWWPLILDLPASRPNGAERDGAAVRFLEPGELRGDPSPLLAAIRAARGCTLDLALTPATSAANGPARILEFGTDHERMNLMVGQAGRDLVVRVRRPGSDPAGAPPLTAARVLDAGRSTRVSISIATDRLALAVDGQDRDELRLSAPPIDAWDEPCELRLGDSPAGDRAWLGTIERAVLTTGGDDHDLLAPGLLRRPAALWYVPERLRLSADWYFFSPADWHDLLINVLGFVPIGLLAALGWRRRPLLAAAAFGLALTLTMEIGQIVVVDRVPSLLDVLLDFSGALIGGWYVGRRLAGRAGLSG